MTPKYRFQWYQQIHENRAKIHEDAREAARELGLEKWRDRVGLYAGSSSCPGPLPGYVLDAIVAANTGPLLPMRAVEDELRGVVKDLFGDEYDGAVTNTCEAALRVSFETLFAPPTMRKGETYRGRFIAPYGEDYEFMAAYGRPFPPRYKNLIADRAVTAGELAVEGKSLPNLDAVFVRLAGARYEGHGIRFNPVPLLTATDAAETRRALSVAAERHASQLVGFESIGYDTPGYGYGEQDDNGVPLLKKYIGELAREFDVPYIVDAAKLLSRDRAVAGGHRGRRDALEYGQGLPRSHQWAPRGQGRMHGSDSEGAGAGRDRSRWRDLAREGGVLAGRPGSGCGRRPNGCAEGPSRRAGTGHRAHRRHAQHRGGGVLLPATRAFPGRLDYHEVVYDGRDRGQLRADVEGRRLRRADLRLGGPLC